MSSKINPYFLFRHRGSRVRGIKVFPLCVCTHTWHACMYKSLLLQYLCLKGKSRGILIILIGLRKEWKNVVCDKNAPYFPFCQKGIGEAPIYVYMLNIVNIRWLIFIFIYFSFGLICAIFRTLLLNHVYFPILVLVSSTFLKLHLAFIFWISGTTIIKFLYGSKNDLVISLVKIELHAINRNLFIPILLILGCSFNFFLSVN